MLCKEKFANSIKKSIIILKDLHKSFLTHFSSPALSQDRENKCALLHKERKTKCHANVMKRFSFSAKSR